MINAWIWCMKDAGYWVTPCLSCGIWFAQRRTIYPDAERADRGRGPSLGWGGARASICRKHRCTLFRQYRRRYGRAPSDGLQAKWAIDYRDLTSKEVALLKSAEGQTA